MKGINTMTGRNSVFITSETVILRYVLVQF